MYLLELRRDADTYHVVVAEDANHDRGMRYNFSDGLALAVPVDKKMQGMTEPTRIKEVLKRAEKSVQASQKQQERTNFLSQIPTGQGDAEEPRTAGADPADG